MASEIIELTKYLAEAKSSSALLLFGFCIILFKSRSFIYFFLELKDLSKKRLLEKFEQESKLKDQNFLSQELKIDYLRYCEELQIHSIIGDRYCRPKMAAYILSRENISDAITKYLRVKDIVKYDDFKNRPVTTSKFNKFREKLNAIIGFILYISLASLALSPYFLYTLTSKEDQLIIISKLTLPHILVLIILAIILFYFAVLSLISGLKPTIANKFCNLPCKNEIHIDL